MAGSDAQAAFYYQNNVAAHCALDLIEFGSQLRSITLEKPERANHIDDIILDQVDGSTFIQVKWAKDDNAAITLHSLVTSDDGTMSLLEKLARGFRHVASEAGQKEIVLLTTKKAGTSRQPAKGFNKSLDEFLKEFHAPYVADEKFDDIRQVPMFAEYEPMLSRLQSSSGLADFRELGSFLKCLRFRLNQPAREAVAERVRMRLATLGIDQSQYGTLLDQIVKWSIDGKVVDRDEVLLKLGLLDHFVDRVSHNFPVDKQQCDPSDVLVRSVPRPSNVTWIDSELSDDDFVQYADIDRMKDSYLHRDEQWVTLYENTQQRIGDAFGASQKRASNVRTIVFGLNHSCKAPTLTEIEHELRRGALAPGRNRYRFELARLESRPRLSSTNLRRKLVPIVRVSRRSFRGRRSPDLAAILPEIASHLRLEPSAEDILGYKLRSKSVVHSIEWQEAFDDDRRLHEPKSSGFLLQIDRELLLGWAHATGLELWAYLVIERTIDRYKPEAQMDWQTYSFAFEMQP